FRVQASARVLRDPLPLAVVRSHDGLSLVQSRRRADVEPPGWKYRLPLTSPYEIETIALVGRQVPSALRTLAEAWQRLRNSPVYGADVLADALLVLVSTVPAAPSTPAPALRAQAPPETPRATAAHPRAFRGTKHAPPKACRPSPLDLRPHLC